MTAFAVYSYVAVFLVFSAAIYSALRVLERGIRHRGILGRGLRRWPSGTTAPTSSGLAGRP